MIEFIGIRLDAGSIVFSDTRILAGLYRIQKMIIYKHPGDRFMVVLSAGELSISQSIRKIVPPVE
ncbi:MAG: hypothetical protein ABI633_01400 [Burkholderiales bacterium]